MFDFNSIVRTTRRLNGDLKKIQEEIGGHYWNSGGNCMILSILLNDTVVAISDELVCEYKLFSGTLEDLVYLNDDCIECTRSVTIREPREIYLIEDVLEELIPGTWFYNKNAAEDKRNQYGHWRVVKFQEVMVDVTTI